CRRLYCLTSGLSAPRSALATRKLATHLRFGERFGIGLFAPRESAFRRDAREEVQGTGDDSGPAGLVAGAQASSVVAVEILVEQDAIAPVRILLEHRRSTVDRSTTVLASEEDVSEPAGDFLGDLIERHQPARARGAFHTKVVTVVKVILE